MRLLLRSAVLGAFLLSPAVALAITWPWTPRLPESAARSIAMHNGVAAITEIHGTIDADWRVEGTDAAGNEVELVIDGKTGAIEHAEMDAH